MKLSSLIRQHVAALRALLVLTVIVGGATSGYSLTGSAKIEMSPAASTTSDNTTAKIGRSMKKREKRT